MKHLTPFMTPFTGPLRSEIVEFLKIKLLSLFNPT